ncbi:hypothetical protein [Paracoccus sp. SY]|uniref:hypothetical protein n=1 Tax=Paracoccus sp. SY TaxID=1330255 RepID=UPI000CD14C52|nr:hypothetical protein [Paracoccus sp. SY]
MNPLLIFKIIRDLAMLIEAANKAAGGKHWSVAFFNRSFVALAIATLASIALALGLQLPIPVDVATENVLAIITVGGIAWAGVERIMGKTKVVWNRQQANDALSEALAKAGAK